MGSPLLSTREKAALLWAEHVTLNTARQRDDVFGIVHESYDDAEIVELTMAICYFNMNNRFVDALKIPVEPMEEVDKIKKSTRTDPEKIRLYLQTILDNWPESFPKTNPD
jgi:hypothetical protein